MTMAGEITTGTRTVFAAVVAFTGRRTPDGRVLCVPEGFRCPAAVFPLPVFGWAQDGERLDAVQVGKIEEAYVIDGRIIVFGHLGNGPVARRCTRQLDAGTHFLEIDTDHVVMELSNETVSPEELADMAGVADVMMVNWRLCSAFVGDKPCWELPPVQLEELIR